MVPQIAARPNRATSWSVLGKNVGNSFCCNVRGTIIESEGKVDDIDYSVYFKRAAVF